MVLGQGAGVLGKGLQESLRVLLGRFDLHGMRIGTRKEQQFLDDLIDPCQLLELDLHRFTLLGLEVAMHEQPLAMQAHQ